MHSRNGRAHKLAGVVGAVRLGWSVGDVAVIRVDALGVHWVD